jgi:hypothetical protein
MKNPAVRSEQAVMKDEISPYRYKSYLRLREDMCEVNDAGTYFNDINADFTCKHCGAFVSALSVASGVINRNHCPFCLYSRHVDLFKAGDRCVPARN